MLPLQSVGFSSVWDGLLQFFTLLEAEASGCFVGYAGKVFSLQIYNERNWFTL